MPLVIKVTTAAGTTLDRAVRDAIGIAIVNQCIVDLCFRHHEIRVGANTCADEVIRNCVEMGLPEAV